MRSNEIRIGRRGFARGSRDACARRFVLSRTFSQGDFNYDGRVNLQDFNILATRFGTVLAGTGRGSLFGGEPLGLDERDEADLLNELVS